MVDNDIYNNERKYLNIIENLDNWANSSRNKHNFVNKDNLQYIPELLDHYDLNDISFIRRCRLLNSFKLLCASTGMTIKDISDSDNRKEIDRVVINARKHYSPSSMECFITDLKIIFKILFPEKDHKGRVDDSITPYVVRHLKASTDKSKQKSREDVISHSDYMKIIDSYSLDSRIQAFISLVYESLGRPQEVLYLKIKDVQLFENYGKANISEHGKEGVGLLRIIESYPYMLKWLNQHPLKDDPEAFVFINLTGKNAMTQLKTHTINKSLRIKCKSLGINPITCYSLKRNGVTHRRLRGDDDKQIQETARWTSTRQLKTYDLAGQEESFKVDLMKRGIIDVDEDHAYLNKNMKITKTCMFCGTENERNSKTCIKCSRLLDRQAIENEQKKKDSELSGIKDVLKLMLMGEQKMSKENMDKYKDALDKL